MNMKRTTLNWLRGAEYDIKTAESLLRGRRYVYVIFVRHLAVEVIEEFKALYYQGLRAAACKINQQIAS
jgi:HEPN domain-containing protein